MTYAFIQDVPANAEIYGQIRDRLGADPPPGLVVHLVQQLDVGLRYVDVWEDEATWTRFRDDRLHPIVTEVLAGYGLPHDESLVTTVEIEVIDAWVGHALVG